MRQLIVKLDDVGRDSSRQVINVILWALQNRYPVSLGTIGAQLKTIPGELVELVRIGEQAGCVEMWNHGFRHIRYDEVPLETAVADARGGDKAIRETFGIEPAGFGFPFNCFTEETIRAVRLQFPRYYIYEGDFGSFRRVTPEYNGYADGQPNLARLLERITSPGNVSNILLQAHPPRWSKAGFYAFGECIRHLVQTRGFVCVSGREALVSEPSPYVASDVRSPVARVVSNIRKLSEEWDKKSGEYASTLPNFKSYFLARFNADTLKNWHQVRSELFPFRPKKILDLGSGLGNWSLPFALSGECGSLVLNDINPTIVRALNEGILGRASCGTVSVNANDLLGVRVGPEDQVDLLVSANTFNYLDPVEYFGFAQASVVSEGRMLLMLQTPAFNRLRYRLAFEGRDKAQGAEALRSDFAMLLRRYLGIFPTGVRHAFSVADVTRLASMFDFSLDSRFAPYGEGLEEGEHVYECLLFRKMRNMGEEISGRQDWLAECVASIGTTFGSKAFDRAGIPATHSSRYFKYDGEWLFGGQLSTGWCDAIQVIRDTIEAIAKGLSVDFVELDKLVGLPSPILELATRVRRLAQQCQ